MCGAFARFSLYHAGRCGARGGGENRISTTEIGYFAEASKKQEHKKHSISFARSARFVFSVFPLSRVSARGYVS